VQPGHRRIQALVLSGVLAAVAIVEPGGVAAATAGRQRGVLTVGDSLTFGSLPDQSPAFIGAGWTSSHVSAHGSRGVVTKVSNDPYTGLTAVDALRRTFGNDAEWVIALGTNDVRRHDRSRYDDLIRTMLDRIGRTRPVVWVNLYLPHQPERMMTWNAALATVSAERPDQLFVYDWAALAAQNPAWLTADGVHYTTAGYRARAFAIAVGARALFDAHRRRD
jgi:lysophospholipase L1-like esterase